MPSITHSWAIYLPPVVLSGAGRGKGRQSREESRGEPWGVGDTGGFVSHAHLLGEGRGLSAAPHPLWHTTLSLGQGISSPRLPSVNEP